MIIDPSFLGNAPYTKSRVTSLGVVILQLLENFKTYYR